MHSVKNLRISRICIRVGGESGDADTKIDKKGHIEADGQGEGGDTDTQIDKKGHIEAEGQGEGGGTNTREDKRGHPRIGRICAMYCDISQ